MPKNIPIAAAFTCIFFLFCMTQPAFAQKGHENQEHAQLSSLTLTEERAQADANRWQMGAKLLIDKQDWKNLVDLALAWTKQQPFNPKAWFVLGAAHEEMGEVEQAKMAFSKVNASQMDPSQLSQLIGGK